MEWPKNRGQTTSSCAVIEGLDRSSPSSYLLDCHRLQPGSKRSLLGRHAAGTLAFTPQQVPSNLSEDILNDWLDRTERIVRLAERNPPTEKAEPTWLARQVEQGRLTLVLIGLLVGAPLVMAFALVAALTVLGLLLKLLA